MAVQKSPFLKKNIKNLHFKLIVSTLAFSFQKKGRDFFIKTLTK